MINSFIGRLIPAIVCAVLLLGNAQVHGQISPLKRDTRSVSAVQAEDFGDAPDLNWFVQLDAYRPIVGMAADHEGNVYSLGNATETTDFFGRTIRRGIFLCKQNGSGEVVWLRQYPGVQLDALQMGDMLHLDTIHQTVLFAGVLRDTLVIPNHAKHFPLGVECLVVVKYNLDGKYIMSFQEELNTFDMEGFTTDRTGNFIISGLFNGTAKIGNKILISEGDRDVLVAKFNIDGEFQWAVRAGGESREYVGLITADTNDNIYIAGEFLSVNVSIDQTHLSMEDGQGNIFFAKINPEGEVQWAKAFAGSGDADKDWQCWPTGLGVSNEGSVYMKGSMADTAYFGQTLLTSQNEWFNKFILKTDLDGNVIWVKALHQSSDRYFFDYSQLEIDPEMSIYFASQALDTMNFGDDFQYVPAGNDLFIARYTSDGALDWVKSFQGTNDPELRIQSIKTYGSENIFVVCDTHDDISVDGQTMESSSYRTYLMMFGDDIAGPVGVTDRQRFTFEVYPNPTNGIITITSAMRGEYNIEIVSCSGRVVHWEKASSANQQISLSHLAKGIYLVRVLDKDSSAVRKLIISR